MVRHLLLLTVAALALGTGCGARPGRVIVLGLDGVDPEVVELLVDDGRLPSFARLKAEGAFGPLEASFPLVSPVLWTTIATGRTPEEHGITSFKAPSQEERAKQPVTSTMRRVRALWDIASEAGREVAVVGWWATWPPSPVNGTMVSDRACYHLLFAEGQQGHEGIRDAVYPPDLAERVAPLIRRPVRHRRRRSCSLRLGPRRGARPAVRLRRRPQPLPLGAGVGLKLRRHRRAAVAHRAARPPDGLHRGDRLGVAPVRPPVPRRRAPRRARRAAGPLRPRGGGDVRLGGRAARPSHGRLRRPTPP